MQGAGKHKFSAKLFSRRSGHEPNVCSHLADIDQLWRDAALSRQQARLRRVCAEAAVLPELATAEGHPLDPRGRPRSRPQSLSKIDAWLLSLRRIPRQYPSALSTSLRLDRRLRRGRIVAALPKFGGHRGHRLRIIAFLPRGRERLTPDAMHDVRRHDDV